MARRVVTFLKSPNPTHSVRVLVESFARRPQAVCSTNLVVSMAGRLATIQLRQIAAHALERAMVNRPPPSTFSGSCSMSGVAGVCACYDVTGYLDGTALSGAFNGKRSCHVPQVPQPDPFSTAAGGEFCPSSSGRMLAGRQLGHNTANTDCSACTGVCTPVAEAPCSTTYPTASVAGSVVRPAPFSGRRLMTSGAADDVSRGRRLAEFAGACSVGGVAGECDCYDVNNMFVGTPNQGLFDGKKGCHVPQLPDAGGPAGGEFCPAGSGRQLFHNQAATDCSSCSGDCGPVEQYRPCVNETEKFYFKTFRHRFFGLQDWTNFNVTGVLSLVDCITYACSLLPTPSPPPVSSGRQLDVELISIRRSLGHGGSNPKAPAGWLPDPSMPLLTESSMMCNISNIVSRSFMDSAERVCLIHYTWFITCLTIPRTNLPIRNFKDAGCKALIILAPCANKGCGPTPYASIVGEFGGKDPIPDFPVVYSADGWFGTSQFPMTQGDSNNGPDDDISVTQKVIFGALPNAGMVLHVMVQDNHHAFIEFMGSTGHLFIYKLMAALYCVLGLFALNHIYHSILSRTLFNWNGYVIIVEGIVGTGFRAFRTITGPYWFNKNTDVFTGQYMTDSAETPFTFVHDICVVHRLVQGSLLGWV